MHQGWQEAFLVGVTGVAADYGWDHCEGAVGYAVLAHGDEGVVVDQHELVD